MAYKVTILPAALRQLADLSKRDQRQAKEKIDRLAVDPRPPGAKKLRAERSYFRVRSGNYRIIYAVDDESLTVLVIKIGHRREVYRGI